MPKVSDLKDSKFLTKEDCDPPIKLTITGWTNENVAMENEPERLKYCLTFKETLKPLVLNNTNGQRIQAITGSDDLGHWAGTVITLYNDKMVMYSGKPVGGVRVWVPVVAPQGEFPQPEQVHESQQMRNNQAPVGDNMDPNTTYDPQMPTGGQPNPNYNPNPAPPTGDVPF